MKLNFSILLFTVILASTLTSFAQPSPDNNNLPQNFYKHLEGKIGGNLNIVMNLIRTDSVLRGSYYYLNNGRPIKFTDKSRIDKNGNIHLEEDGEKWDDNYNKIVTGIFNGKFERDGKITGSWEKPGSDKTLKFELKETYENGSAKFDVKSFYRSYKDSLAKILIVYPVMAANDGEVEQKINYDIEKILQDTYSPDTVRYKNADTMMASFINRYTDLVKEMSGKYPDYHPRFDDMYITSILHNRNNLLVTEDFSFTYEGGAHPLTTIYYDNYDLQTGDKLRLDDLFKTGYRKEFNKIGEKQVRKYLNIGPDVNLEEAGLFIKSGEFNVNSNFEINKAGITFLFNQYEIAPYALGQIKISIPFNQIKEYIKDGSLLSELLKKN